MPVEFPEPFQLDEGSVAVAESDVDGRRQFRPGGPVFVAALGSRTMAGDSQDRDAA